MLLGPRDDGEGEVLYIGEGDPVLWGAVQMDELSGKVVRAEH
ncbi:MAG: hypothetical protein R8K50_00300 [Mariprofundus sp.]